MTQATVVDLYNQPHIFFISGTLKYDLNFLARYLLSCGASLSFGIQELGHHVNALEIAIESRMFKLAAELVTDRGMDPFSTEGRVCGIEQLIRSSEWHYYLLPYKKSHFGVDFVAGIEHFPLDSSQYLGRSNIYFQRENDSTRSRYLTMAMGSQLIRKTPIERLILSGK